MLRQALAARSSVTGASSGIGEATARLLTERGARVLLGGRRRERLGQLAREIRERGGNKEIQIVGKLADKVAVVTGASKGIGAAIARHLVAEGAAVVVNYSTSPQGADRVVRDIVSAGGTAIAVGANLAIESEIAKLFEATKTRFGRVDILVNNAGVYTFAPIEAVTPELYNRMFNINVLGLLLTTKAALPLFPAAGGSIVNISSVASTLAPPDASVYAASKAAVETITKVLAKELGPRKIRVNAVSAGPVATEGYDAAGFTGSDFERQAIAMTPLGRVGQPDDIALPVAYLASEDARWITGEILYASGGAAV